MKASTTKAIAEISTRAAGQPFGGWVKQESPAGVIEACTIKKHIAGKPFASFVTNFRLNGKRIAMAKLAAQLDAA